MQSGPCYFPFHSSHDTTLYSHPDAAPTATARPAVRRLARRDGAALAHPARRRRALATRGARRPGWCELRRSLLPSAGCTTNRRSRQTLSARRYRRSSKGAGEGAGERATRRAVERARERAGGIATQTRRSRPSPRAAARRQLRSSSASVWPSHAQGQAGRRRRRRLRRRRRSPSTVRRASGWACGECDAVLPLSSPLERPKSRGAVSSAYSTDQREPYVGASCRRSETLVTQRSRRDLVRYVAGFTAIVLCR